MIEKITKELKPKLNLDWYDGRELYSQGEVEELIIKIIMELEPEDYSDAIYHNFCWPVFYHLTHLRQNIINWYPFKQDAQILEIGCGFGAITGFLCDCCKSVVSIELSKHRAEAVQWRCREKENLEIIVGRLDDIQFDQRFDYITLIDFAAAMEEINDKNKCIDTLNLCQDYLKRVKMLLKPEGKLLIAIENQYGLKYWCGAKEDHTGIPFQGLNQFAYKDVEFRTFSKASLDTLIKGSGFKNTFFYYPMPDYKMPKVIYSQNNLPKDANMENMQCYYAPDQDSLVAREADLYQDIIQNQVFEFFANSFFVECTDADDYGKVSFACISSERMREYRIGTRIIEKKGVEKFMLNKLADNNHLKNVLINQMMLEERGLKVWKYWMHDKTLITDYTEAQTLQDLILEKYRNKDLNQICAIWDLLYEEIIKSSEKVAWEQNIMYTLNWEIESDAVKYGPVLKNAYIDMILRNAFWIEGGVYWFDQEWALENVPAKYIMFKALLEFYTAFSEMDHVFSMNQAALRYGLVEIWKELQALEDLLQGLLMDQQQWQESTYFRRLDPNIYISNIKKLLNLE